ncbi:MAG TPA: hypothetical protein DIT07_16560, partial [Sphingobacteriaceae bacterium]|nr:hypothetical protein [Sphingobacteriaceae bacterium]
ALADGSIKSFPLPAIKNAGTVMSVTNNTENDSTVVIISSTLTSATATSGTAYYLTAQSRGIICYGAVIR